MHTIIDQIVRVLMVAGLITNSSAAILEAEALVHIPHCEPMATEALALRPVAFDSKLYPSKVRDYLQGVSVHIASDKDAIKEQILRLPPNEVRHEKESGNDLVNHLVFGPEGMWVHGHLNGLGNGTLIKVERSPAGIWRPVNFLVEWANEPRHESRSSCFFPIAALVRSRSWRAALLSKAGPLVSLYQDLLDRSWKRDSAIPIALLMGQGITPGTEGAWVIEPLQHWDPESGLWMEPRRGWTFLRAGKNRENLNPLDQGIFILRWWAKTIDAKANEFFRIPLQPIPRPVNRQNLAALMAWLETITWASTAYVEEESRQLILRQITHEEIAYVKFLLQQIHLDQEYKAAHFAAAA